MDQRKFQALCPVSDECYLTFKESFDAAKKKKTWKETLLSETGQKKCVTHRIFKDIVFFVFVEDGIEIMIISETMMETHFKEQASLIGVPLVAPSPEEFDERPLANSTGNHKGKAHKVRINTAAGQPVRG